jgi:chlorophyll synthase
MARPHLSAVAELLKPITWFPPMWAFACGAVASGISPSGRWLVVIVGVLLAGPLVCATSQAANDWFDRFVDAINEPQRPIPSGRMPGEWGFYIAIAWTALSLGVAATLGWWVLGPRSGSRRKAGGAIRRVPCAMRAWHGSPAAR